MEQDLDSKSTRIVQEEHKGQINGLSLYEVLTFDGHTIKVLSEPDAGIFSRKMINGAAQNTHCYYEIFKSSKAQVDSVNIKEILLAEERPAYLNNPSAHKEVREFLCFLRSLPDAEQPIAIPIEDCDFLAIPSDDGTRYESIFAIWRMGAPTIDSMDTLSRLIAEEDSYPEGALLILDEDGDIVEMQAKSHNCILKNCCNTLHRFSKSVRQN